MLWSIVLGLILFIAVFHIVFPVTYAWPSVRRRQNKVPGPPRVPFIGSRFVLSATNEVFLSVINRLANEFGKIFRIDILGHVVIMVSNVADAEKLMNSKSHISKSADYKLLLPWLGTGLLTSTGDKWARQRKLLTPAFHFGILEPYIEVFARNAKILGDNIAKLGRKPIEINRLISLCTLDIVCETAMGTKVNAQLGGAEQYVKDVLEMSKLFQIRQLSPWFYRDCIFELFPAGKLHKETLNRLHNFTKTVIDEKRKIFRSECDNVEEGSKYAVEGKKRKAFLDLLIEISEKEGGMTEDEIREEVDTFMFEGHDTTAAAISWSLFELGLNPEIQNTAHEELDRIFGESDRDVTNADLAEMKFLERVIKEALRLYPSVPLIGRELEEDITLSGYDIPAGTNAAVLIYYIHRDPELYQNPDKFDPDRFLSDKMAKRHPFSYIPFSAGPRNCIGQKFAMMEEKTVLSQILRRFTVKTLTKKEELGLMAELILRPKESIKMVFTPRY